MITTIQEEEPEIYPREKVREIQDWFALSHEARAHLQPDYST
jgi:hypothetical protein